MFALPALSPPPARFQSPNNTHWQIQIIQKQTNTDFILPQRPESWNLTLSVKLKIAHSIASSLEYLHEMNIIHRDMKTENLLLNTDFEICIADLGISCIRSQRMTKGMGTPRYMAPELLEGKPYGEKADVFSFSIIFWEIFAEQVPYQSEGLSAWFVLF